MLIRETKEEEMESNAQKIRERYMELLSDGRPHGRQELFAYAREQSGGNHYTEGMLTGALKVLVDSGNGYQCVGRAVYQKVENHEERQRRIVMRYAEILKKTLEETERERVNPMELLEIDEDEKRKMQEIRKCIQVIQDTVEQVEES